MPTKKPRITATAETAKIVPGFSIMSDPNVVSRATIDSTSKSASSAKAIKETANKGIPDMSRASCLPRAWSSELINTLTGSQPAATNTVAPVNTAEADVPSRAVQFKWIFLR